MTREELDDLISLNIGSKTAPASLTNTEHAEVETAIADYIDQQIGSLYKAVISQSGTSAPTKTDKINTTGLTFTITRQDVGVYRLTPSSLISSDINFKLYFNTASYPVPNYVIDNLGIFIDITVKYWNGTTFIASDDVINVSVIELEIFN